MLKNRKWNGVDGQYLVVNYTCEAFSGARLYRYHWEPPVHPELTASNSLHLHKYLRDLSQLCLPTYKAPCILPYRLHSNLAQLTINRDIN